MHEYVYESIYWFRGLNKCVFDITGVYLNQSRKRYQSFI